MIGLHANVLVRYLMIDPDEPGQSQLARSTVESALERSEPIFVSNIVMCESVWAWMQIYKITRQGVSNALGWILEEPLIKLESHSMVSRAAQMFRTDSVDLADLMIVTTGQESGCKTTYTFDKAASKVAGFSLLK